MCSSVRKAVVRTTLRIQNTERYGISDEKKANKKFIVTSRLPVKELCGSGFGFKFVGTDESSHDKNGYGRHSPLLTIKPWSVCCSMEVMTLSTC